MTDEYEVSFTAANVEVRVEGIMALPGGPGEAWVMKQPTILSPTPEVLASCVVSGELVKVRGIYDAEEVWSVATVRGSEGSGWTLIGKAWVPSHDGWDEGGLDFQVRIKKSLTSTRGRVYFLA